MKLLLKIMALIIGTVLILNGVALFFVSNVNLGSFLTIAMGAAIIFVTVSFKKTTRWLKSLLVIVILLAFVFSSFLFIYGKSDNATYKEDAVIVLGAAVHGKTPSLSLRRRLDQAVLYHTKNPNAIIVVSGGQGPQEDITEAAAMETYLINNGVDPTKIIKEDKATSTYENFVFSKEILDKHFNKEYTTVFITNEYHVFRASLCAKSAGITALNHQHSNTSFSYLTSGTLRECLAVAKYVILKN